MIVVCEMQCCGYEHVDVNSSILTLLNLAYPDEKIKFLAQDKHLDLVISTLQNQNKLIPYFEFYTINVPDRRASSLRRLPLEWRIITQVLEENRNRRVFFTSLTNSGLLALKVLLNLSFKYDQVRPLVVLHGNFATIIKHPSLRPGEIMFWFKWILALPCRHPIKYIVLSPSIEPQVKKLLARSENKFIYIDLPYFSRPVKAPITWREGIIKFASLGSAHRGKGTHLFFKLADYVRAALKETKAQFHLVGHFCENLFYGLRRDNLICHGIDRPLSAETYAQVADNINYAVFLYDRKAYKLTGSASLFDAFSFGKPIIAIRNDLFEYYFKAMGDIGYLCDSFEDVKQCIINIINNPDEGRYLSQCRNLLQGRAKIDIGDNALKVRDKLRDFWD